MHAAVVTAFDTPPRYLEHADPVTADGSHVLEVLASGLAHRVRSQADGTHYTSAGALPLVPGVDGVGRDADGTLRYFVVESGAMAERVVVEPGRSVALAPDTDAAAVAGGMNPVMSSWVALRHRVPFEPGMRVLVLGATGASGGAAVQVARRFGAVDVVAAGRNAGRLAELPALGATATVSLVGTPDEVGARLATAAADVDVVLDYLWGDVATAAMTAIVTARNPRGRTLHWVQIGSLAGADATVPSAALRQSGLTLVGSGQGSVGARQMLAELPAIAAAITAGEVVVPVRTVPLADVESAWAAPDASARTVLVP